MGRRSEDHTRQGPVGTLRHRPLDAQPRLGGGGRDALHLHAHAAFEGQRIPLLPVLKRRSDMTVFTGKPPLDPPPRAAVAAGAPPAERARPEEHTSELQSLMRIPYAVSRL